jgi:PPK2 family polyphosphate:nucleotide phosphotransferase
VVPAAVRRTLERDDDGGALTVAKDTIVRLASRFVVTKGKNFRLDDVDPGGTKGFSASREEAASLLQETVGRISKQQETLYAQDQWGVLLIFQAMDAAGKDSAIKHVFSGINPQGVQVFSFKAPSAEELDHDFLWRTSVRLPERGRIGVFNRSYYEEVLVVRVHPEIFESERLPARVVTRRIWDERFQDINAFELHLARNGYVIRKFFLHVSPDEQARRFLERLEEPHKRWKFSMGDIRERDRWPDYMQAYEEAIRRTSAPHAPWVVVPADKKWFARLVIAGTIADALEGLKLQSPKVSPGQERELEEVRAALSRALARPRKRGKRP